MSSKQNPAGSGIHASDAEIAAALEQASIPCLLMSMIHMSGDSSLLDSELRPMGLYINEYQGYMSEEAKASVRTQALTVIRDFRDGGRRLARATQSRHHSPHDGIPGGRRSSPGLCAHATRGNGAGWRGSARQPLGTTAGRGNSAGLFSRYYRWRYGRRAGGYSPGRSGPSLYRH